MGFIEVLHTNIPICTRILIPKDRLAIFTNYPSVTKDQALAETVLTLFYRFQLIGVTIEDTIAHHNVHQRLTLKSSSGRFSAH